MPQNESADLAHVASLIAKVQIAMLTTADENGELRSRPMAVQQTPFDGTLRFFTRDDSGKVDEIEREREVNVAVSDADQGIFVSLSGKARLERDRAKINELWRDELSVWFPGGKDDPHLALLAVRGTYAEFWDTPGGQKDQDSKEKHEESAENSEYGKVEIGS